MLRLPFITSLISNLKTNKKAITPQVTRKSIYAQALERGEVPPIESLIKKDKAETFEDSELNKPTARPNPTVAVTRKSIYAQALERGEVPPIKSLIKKDKAETFEDSELNKPTARPNPTVAVTRKSIYAQALEKKERKLIELQHTKSIFKDYEYPALSFDELFIKPDTIVFIYSQEPTHKLDNIIYYKDKPGLSLREIMQDAYKTNYLPLMPYLHVVLKVKDRLNYGDEFFQKTQGIGEVCMRRDLAEEWLENIRKKNIPWIEEIENATRIMLKDDDITEDVRENTVNEVIIKSLLNSIAEYGYNGDGKGLIQFHTVLAHTA